MAKVLKVLSIEDSADDALLIQYELDHSGYDIHIRRIEDASALAAALDDEEWDLILSDYSLPHFNAPSALKLIQARGLDIPFIIVSGTVGEDAAVAAMKAGAHDFFSKDHLKRLVPAIERELRDLDERRERRRAETRAQQYEERFARAFQASPVAMLMSTRDDLIVDANARAVDLLGYARSEMLDRSSSALNIWMVSGFPGDGREGPGGRRGDSQCRNPAAQPQRRDPRGRSVYRDLRRQRRHLHPDHAE